jgi:hypothetical protein
VSSDFNLVSVEVNAGASGLEIGSPKVLYSITGWASGAFSPAGERFVGVVLPEGGEKPKVALVANWTAGLKK